MPHAEGTRREYELTFLARVIPQEIRDMHVTKILDVYVPEDPAVHSHVRLRQQGNTYELTKKVPASTGDASVLTEQTIRLEREEFTGLAMSKKRVEKVRYSGTIKGYAAEVDVFHGRLQGLVLIDFEFDEAQQMQSFVPPACCLADVTQEAAFAGGNLAGRAYADIEAKLRRYGYAPL